MKNLLTPKQIAGAINVSESSIKRWCDKGKIETSYTAGGHRRIHVSSILSFLRSSKHNLVNPQSLGLPDRSDISTKSYEEIQQMLVNALVNGDEGIVQQLIVEMILAESSIAKILDRHVAAAFNTIGDLWQCGQAEVYQERRACEMSVRALNELRRMTPDPAESAPVALGATPPGDHYQLATSMVELVLRNANWNATSMGANVPLESLAVAIRTHRPKLVWLSITHLESPDQFVAEYQSLYGEFSNQVTFVIGGQSADSELRQRINFSAFCENLQKLETFVSSIKFETPAPSFAANPIDAIASR